MYIARKPFRYENRVFMQGEHVTVKDEDVRMLQGQGKIGGRVIETASVKPPENAMQPKAESKHIGGGWYLTEDGRKVRKSDLESG